MSTTKEKIETVRPSLGARMLYPFRRLFSPTLPAECGHATKLIGAVQVHGGYTYVSASKPKTGKMQCCIECVEKGAIRCAWCGKYIIYDNAVTLYIPKEGVVMPEYAVPYGDQGAYVGCYRWECADTGLDRAGFWVYPGTVRRDSLLGKVMGNLQNGEAVIVENPGSSNPEIQSFQMPAKPHPDLQLDP